MKSRKVRIPPRDLFSSDIVQHFEDNRIVGPIDPRQIQSYFTESDALAVGLWTREHDSYCLMQSKTYHVKLIVAVFFVPDHGFIQSILSDLDQAREFSVRWEIKLISYVIEGNYYHV